MQYIIWHRGQRMLQISIKMSLLYSYRFTSVCWKPAVQPSLTLTIFWSTPKFTRTKWPIAVTFAIKTSTASTTSAFTSTPTASTQTRVKSPQFRPSHSSAPSAIISTQAPRHWSIICRLVHTVFRARGVTRSSSVSAICADILSCTAIQVSTSIHVMVIIPCMFCYEWSLIS